MTKYSFKRKLAVLATVMVAFAVTGCKQTMIDHVKVKLADDLLTLRVSLVFSESIQPDFAGSYPLKNYGNLFISPYIPGVAEPYVPVTPFEVGFDLNTMIVNDQDYAQFTPTDSLPNGLAIGIGYPVVEIKGVSPVGSSFDVYGYVDILHREWLGVATMFKIMNKYFPENLSLNQAFLKNDLGKPGIIASAFGPELNPDGTVKRPAGISMFANVVQLMNHAVSKSQHELILYPEK